MGTVLLKLRTPKQVIYCLECYPTDTVSDICRHLKDVYGVALTNQFDYHTATPDVPIGILHDKAICPSERLASDLPHGPADILRLVATVATLSTAPAEPPPKVGEVYSKDSLVRWGYTPGVVDRKWEECGGNFLLTLRGLLADDTQTPRKRLPSKEAMDLNTLERQFKQKGAPSKVDLFAAFLINDKDRVKAAKWLNDQTNAR
jgi:hypothetical protein